MATIGQILTVPESGWLRYDYSSSFLTLVGPWFQVSSRKQTSTAGSTISFTFRGTKFRVLCMTDASYGNNHTVKVDGVQVGTFTNKAAPYAQASVLVFESELLEDTKHTVTLTVGTGFMIFTGVDILQTTEPKWLGVSGREFTPVSPNASTSTNTNVWIYNDENVATSSHQSGTGSKTTATNIAGVFDGNAVTGYTLPDNFETSEYDMYVYAKSYSTIGFNYRVNGGAWAPALVALSAGSASYAWIKTFINRNLQAGDTIEFLARGGGACILIRDVMIQESALPDPTLLPTGQEGIRSANTYIFNNCGKTGYLGPTQAQVDASYTSGNTLYGKVTSLLGIQKWVVPKNGYYKITCRGAGGLGNNVPGKPALLTGEFQLTQGETLLVLIGQIGGSYVYGCAGGGTFVAKGADLITSIPLIVAGGGGSRSSTVGSAISDASLTTTGNPGATTAGGINGLGGVGGASPYPGGSGAGFYGDGVIGRMGGTPAKAFRNGGNGNNHGIVNQEGGFGGGGASGQAGGSGGGGYSGGGTGAPDYSSGGGGGSFNSGLNPTAELYGASSLEGSVTIDLLYSNFGPSYTLSTDRTTTHNQDVIISGTIAHSENDRVIYKISINGTVFQNWSNFAYPEVSIACTIPASSLNFGDNLILVTMQDEMGSTSTWSQVVTRTNEVPTILLTTDRSCIFNKDIQLDTTITDVDGDNVKYRMYVNNVLLQDWGNLSVSPLSASRIFSMLDFNLNVNQITVESQDSLGGTGTGSISIYKKSLDGTYVSGLSPNENLFSETKLVASATDITLLKYPMFDGSKGYLKSANLTLSVKTPGNGHLKVYKIKESWDSTLVTNNTCPELDLAKYVTSSVNGESTFTVDITTIMGVNGVAIFSTDTTVEFEILGNSIAYDYQPTVLQQPKTVFGNKVKLEWLPILLDKPEAFVKLVIESSTSSDFSNVKTVSEVTDIDTLSYIDETISKGVVYYRLKVHCVDNESNGNQLDFDVSDEGGFIQQNESMTEFKGGVLGMQSMPVTTDIQTCDSDVGFVYDSEKVDIINGKVQLHQTGSISDYVTDTLTTSYNGNFNGNEGVGLKNAFPFSGVLTRIDNRHYLAGTTGTFTVHIIGTDNKVRVITTVNITSSTTGVNGGIATAPNLNIPVNAGEGIIIKSSLWQHGATAPTGMGYYSNTALAVGNTVSFGSTYGLNAKFYVSNNTMETPTDQAYAVTLPPVITVGRKGITSITVVDSSPTAQNIQPVSDMSVTTFGIGKLWTGPINKHASLIEVI